MGINATSYLGISQLYVVTTNKKRELLLLVLHGENRAPEVNDLK